MKKSNSFIVVLCLLVAVLSLVVAFGPMIKNLKPADETTALSDGSDISSDLDNSDDVSSDVPGGGSSDLPDDSGSSDFPDNSDSSELPDDSGSSELPDVNEGRTVTIHASRENSTSCRLIISYLNSEGDLIRNTYDDPGIFDDVTGDLIEDLDIILEDVSSDIFLDFTNLGFINVYDENMNIIFDGESIEEGICIIKETYSELYVVGIYN